VDHVVGTLGDCCWALGVDLSGWKDWSGFCGSGSDELAALLHAAGAMGARDLRVVRRSCERSSDMVYGVVTGECHVQP
jgi:hypothetical protein